MAYAATVNEIADVTVGGVRYISYAIGESDIGTTDLAEVALGHQVFTVTLFEAHLRVAGSASTIDPELFIATGTPSAMVNTLDEVSTTATAAAYQRVGDNVRVVSTTGSLFLYSNPDLATGATGRIDTRITIAVGHR
jgi:hypothetical protein